MLSKLSGYKTYIGLVIAALGVLANAFLGVEVPGTDLDPNNWVAQLWALAVAAFGRSAIAKK